LPLTLWVPPPPPRIAVAQVAYYISQSKANNHAVREAACACIAELMEKVRLGVVVAGRGGCGWLFAFLAPWLFGFLGLYGFLASACGEPSNRGKA